MKKLSYIHKGDTGAMSFETKQRSFNQMLFILYGFGVGIFLLVALARLFQLTIVKGNYYSVLSEDNRVKEIVIEAPRGKLIDRKGIVLATNSEPKIKDDLVRVTSKR